MPAARLPLRRALGAAAALVLASGVVGVEARAGTIALGVDVGVELELAGAAPSTAHACGELDRPETGVQGDVPLADQESGRAREGYTCGLSVIGANTLGGRSGNGNMAWSGDCAYVAGDGVSVVDARDPTAPVQVTTLHGPGSDMSIETLAAVDAPDRHLLAAGRYGIQSDYGLTGQGPVDLYDVTDCAHPRLLTTFWFPGAVHNLTFSADGRRLWSTLPLQAADTTDPAHPAYLGNLDDALRASGPFHLQYAHEVWPSADGTRIVVGGQEAVDEATMIFDVAEWPAEPPRLLGQFAGPGHSVRTATIGGRDYVLHSDESISPFSNGCSPSLLTPFGGPAEPVLTDVTDLAHPVDTGTLRLAINQPQHCPDALASGVNGSSHYHDVDDPNDTTFAMVSMWNAGLRLFDVRDPADPTEVAYFNPGLYDLGSLSNPVDVLGLPSRGVDQAWAHVRYRPDTGHIWLATRAGGFWVLELQPQLRAALGLPAMPSIAPLGGPARPEAVLAGQPAPSASTGGGDALVYCTVTGRIALPG
jgi:hypothetical protein